MKPEHGGRNVDADDLGLVTPAEDALFVVPPPLDAEPAMQPAPASRTVDTLPILGVLWRAIRRRRS